MEDQQKRHVKEVHMDSALRPLASDRSSDSVSNFSFKSRLQQNFTFSALRGLINTNINDITTATSNATNAIFFAVTTQNQANTNTTNINTVNIKLDTITEFFHFAVDLPDANAVYLPFSSGSKYLELT